MGTTYNVSEYAEWSTGTEKVTGYQKQHACKYLIHKNIYQV